MDQKQMSVEQVQDYRENFGTDDLTFGAMLPRAKFIKDAGFDGLSNDDIFADTKYVYCVSHVRPHKTGWCTAGPVNQYPLVAKDNDAAYQETRALGFHIYGDEN